MLANNACAHESLRNRISCRKFPVRRSVTRALHALFAPHSPTPVRVQTVSGAADAKANSLQSVGRKSKFLAV